MADTGQNAWVERVLGYTFAGPGAGTASGSFTDAAAAWRAAMESVDGQIAQLQAALRQTDDGDLHEIAEYGLNAVTGGHKAKLTAALMGAERGAAGDRAKLAALIPPFCAHLESDERVEAVDENPFGVAMSVRATLLPALDELARGAAA